MSRMHYICTYIHLYAALYTCTYHSLLGTTTNLPQPPINAEEPDIFTQAVASMHRCAWSRGTYLDIENLLLVVRFLVTLHPCVHKTRATSELAQHHFPKHCFSSAAGYEINNAEVCLITCFKTHLPSWCSHYHNVAAFHKDIIVGTFLDAGKSLVLNSVASTACGAVDKM
jgi:hypothetical protein